MHEFICESCNDTGYVMVANGPDDSEKVSCPDCEKGLQMMERELGDMMGATDREGNTTER